MQEKVQRLTVVVKYNSQPTPHYHITQPLKKQKQSVLWKYHNVLSMPSLIKGATNNFFGPNSTKDF